MKKYNIEGNIDFFAELYKSLDIEEHEGKTIEDENLCLISNEPLTDFFFKMDCGHKFNYIPLFNDIKNHKQKFNNLEGTNSRLRSEEIRCPYCRHIQKSLLPYHEELGLKKTHGVNFIDLDKKTTLVYHNMPKCQYVTTNPSLDASSNSVENIKCYHYSYYKISEHIVNYTGEEMYLCFSHKRKMIKDHNKNLKDAEKQKIKEEKIKAKEEAKKAKELEKASKKKKKVKAENVVISASISIEQSSNDTCIEILKSGPKKGLPCCQKTTNSSLYCKRHNKVIENKTMINQENTNTNPEI